MAHTIVIFGASGDLTSRKLIPALYELHRKKRLPEDTRVVGFSRTKFSHDAWRQKLAETTAQFVGRSFDAAQWQEFAPSIFYYSGDVGNAEDFPPLKAFLADLDGGQAVTRVYYLATAPQLYAPIVAQLGVAGLAGEDRGPSRVVIEKPFGTDLASARELNEKVHKVFAEHQVYRIDHYLGKETVQNVMVLRFANSIFEPIWNRNYIDHVQITAAEGLTVEHRAAYYDSVGVLRDMFQNHLLQLMTLTAMEAPAQFEADAIRDEKVKVLRSVRLMKPEEVFTDTIRGQYRTYRDEPGIPPDSQTGHLRRRQAQHRQLALAGRPLPVAQRQGHVLPNHADRHPVPPGPAHDVRGRAAGGVRVEPPGHPGAARRGHPVALPNQGARRRHEASPDRPELQLPRPLQQQHARGLRAAAAGRPARRRQPVLAG